LAESNGVASDLPRLVARAKGNAEELRELSLLRPTLEEYAAESGLELAAEEASRLHAAIDELLVAFAAHMLEHQAEELQLFHRFVNVLGHDLRNPISAIKLGSSMLLRDPKQADGSRRTAERISSSANRMLRMVEDLLDFVRTRPGTDVALDLAAVALRELCSQVVAECRAAHPLRTIIFDEGVSVSSDCDRRLLGNALTGVVSVALQHSHQQGAVRVTLDQPEGPRIQIHADGQTLNAEQLQALLEPLTRREADESKSTRPAGLGLYLVNRIVLAHGGRLAAESRDGAGTILTLILPSRAKD
jgi:phosphoserine phosphatase RsbU/P